MFLGVVTCMFLGVVTCMFLGVVTCMFLGVVTCMFLGVVTCMFLGVVTCMFLGGIDLASVSMSFRLDFRTAVRVVMFASLFYFILLEFFSFTYT
jgi:hypothetical protein